MINLNNGGEQRGREKGRGRKRAREGKKEKGRERKRLIERQRKGEREGEGGNRIGIPVGWKQDVLKIRRCSISKNRFKAIT